MGTPANKTYLNRIEAPDRARAHVGGLSGESFTLPDVNSGYPQLRVVTRDGSTDQPFDRGAGLPDTRSPRLKLGVLVPATNCTVESESWDVLFANREALAGVGLHTVVVRTPDPRFGNADELARYEAAFLRNLLEAAELAQLAEPEYLILGFSLEHFSSAVDRSHASAREIQRRTGLGIATWAKASKAALDRFGARRIGLLCPFDPTGTENAAGFFENLGYEVAAAVGLSCASGTDVGHVPDSLKEQVIREQLLPAGRLDAIVQCGTNLSFLDPARRLEPELGIPLIGVNVATLWYALRELGVTAPLNGPRLLQEH